ncbi:MAG: fumarate hydratase [Clostridiales bacterium GWF2_38_85]|nr:MAG: fumarate hydratase [Clostridiales bacterium GWF2_38_85]HBL85365.1 TRZ/ATZ family protein [Clostridiales bacterium]
MIEINTAEIKSFAEKLHACDDVLLSGTVYTARDAAHMRMIKMLDKGEKLPIDINGAVIYYAGPTPAPEGAVIGSAGPTTSGRMDEFTPSLYDLGLGATIGKGQRNKSVCEAIIRNKAPYFIAIGGAGALYARHITSCEIIAFEELGCEAIRKLTFHNFPVYTAIDCFGGNIFNA